MQKQQVFKVKGMQRDASMANANGEFAYEILNMRLMPAEDLSGFSLTNEKGTTEVITGIHGQVIGQCPTNDSLVVFTTNATYNENDERTGGFDYIYEIYQTPEGHWDGDSVPLYKGDLNFHADKHIEALFNYETEDIQKVYWIDGINQLRCINLVGEIQTDNNQQFDSVKEINSLPSVEIERVIGGSFTAGVIQYYVTYFNEFLSESPIVYTSPLLYITYDNRGANVNDQVSTAFKLTFTDLDTTNWEYMRIYATHRTSIDATPEASIVTELNMDNSTIEFTDYGSNRTSIAPTDLYFTGGKFVKAGTMTVKDQVMFLGNLNIETPETVSVVEIQKLFDSIRDNKDHPFTTTTRKAKENKLEEYEDTHYYYKNQLKNTESITHYKYGEKYRFGISVLDKYGNWSNPIWIKDAFIEIPPEQVDSTTLELPCPSLNLSYSLTYEGKTRTILEHLQDRGAISIKPLVVFPKEEERKVIAQGVVCPTVYNLKDRKENGPYAQASWFMRPNAPVDLWGFDHRIFGTVANYSADGHEYSPIKIFHKSDMLDEFMWGTSIQPTWDDVGYFGAASYSWDSLHVTALDNSEGIQPYELMLDDSNPIKSNQSAINNSQFKLFVFRYPEDATPWKRWEKSTTYSFEDAESFETNVIQKGSWLEFRHNYALRSAGWSFGSPSGSINNLGNIEGTFFSYGNSAWSGTIKGGHRSAEISTAQYKAMLPVNRLYSVEDKQQYRKWDDIDNDGSETSTDNAMCGNSAYYIDNSIITVNTPEIELSKNSNNESLQNVDFRIIGIIPLTATCSDMFLEVSNPSPNPSNYPIGLKVIHTTNTNIGMHGFKGVVSHNAYFADPKTSIAGYHTVLLNPWHTTGNILAIPASADGRDTNDHLKRKILSNLRYSASTIFFRPDCLNMVSVDEEEYNKAFLTEQSSHKVKIGWKPINGSQVLQFDGEQKILKFNDLPYSTTNDEIYYGNIDSIAMPTAGDNTTIKVAPSAINLSGFSQKASQYNNTNFVREDDWAYTGIGPHIRYKSSPHYVIAFNPCRIDKWKTQKVIQETLPTFIGVNQEGISGDIENIFTELNGGRDALGNIKDEALRGQYAYDHVSSIYHQSYLYTDDFYAFSLARDSDYPRLSYSYKNQNSMLPAYGWLWLGEIYRETDPTFGGTSDWALQNNQWENGGKSGYDMVIDTTQENLRNWTPDIYNGQIKMEYSELEWSFGEIFVTMSNDGLDYLIDIPAKSIQILKKHIQSNAISSIVQLPISTFVARDGNDEFKASDILIDTRIYKSENKYGIVFLNLPESYIGEVDITDIHYEDWFFTPSITWTQGDTYYQRFDTLKTYAYSDSDQNSVIDITSFMVETRINIDGRTDRNRGQESNLQMSPTNFNLMNDVYSQRDNFFTYRILDEDIQARTNFPNQITWSLTKTAGATVDAWMNITLASVLDLDGTKGKISALKNFNNNIIAFQEKGLSHIMFNSRAQIATSEAVPIQIANTGKVDGQQYFTTDVGCQDKWNIVTTPNGLYFVDYFNKSIYRFNGQLEDISTPNGFRSWCYENLSSTANIIGYYDVKNKEVMYYIGDTSFELSQHYVEGETLKPIEPQWLGFSELTGTFSSFYTYPKAWFANVQDQGLWLLSGDDTKVYTHQTGDYNELLNTDKSFYGLTVIPRQDSNTVKTFNNVEFRADSFDGNGYNEDLLPVDTISTETEYQPRTTDSLVYNKYRPSNLKKKFRTWRANIPRVNNGYNRFVNQWAKIGLWKMNPGLEKTILHDLSVWYSE